MALAQGERGVKMPRIENYQSVLVGGQDFVGSSARLLA